MKLYNVGTEVFEFTYGGNIYTLFPRCGTFTRIKDPYTVDVESASGKKATLKRTKDKWVKKSDEGKNDNSVEIPREAYSIARKAADDAGLLDFIKNENVVLKDEQSKVEELEKLMAFKDKEMKEKEQEFAKKLALLQRATK